MFAKKKIVLNSAINDNKVGLAEISCLDSLTRLQIKISNYKPNKNSSYIFLLKNNGIQQRFIVTDPRNFECDVAVPVDLNQKISCLLIENGIQQTPIFWGGTDTKTKTFNNINTDEINNKTNAIEQKNNDFNQQTNTFNTAQNDLKIENNLHNEQKSNFESETELKLHKNDPQEALFETDNLSNDIDCAMNDYQLIKDYVEQDFPQCANCKYKDVFFRERQMQQAKEQLQKIAELQKKDNEFDNLEENEQNEYNHLQMNTALNNDNYSNSSSNQCKFLNSNSNNFHESCTESNPNNNYETINSSLSNLNNLNTQSSNNAFNAPNETQNDLVFGGMEDDLSNNQDENAKSEPYYYSLIKTQYEEMFNKYPAFEKLSNIIENSKWITVESIDEPYLMGIIYNGNKPQYLCYGVIQDRKQTPPIEIIDSSQWVPFDINNEFGAGAYIMYQSAENGETIKVEVS